jgi:hypothetical protein
MKDVEQDLYLTKDLSEASSLVCKGLKLIRLEKENNFYWFVFQDKSACEQLSNTYWNNELQVSAKAYSTALKELKDRLFSRAGQR